MKYKKWWLFMTRENILFDVDICEEECAEFIMTLNDNRKMPAFILKSSLIINKLGWSRNNQLKFARNENILSATSDFLGGCFTIDKEFMNYVDISYGRLKIDSEKIQNNKFDFSELPFQLYAMSVLNWLHVSTSVVGIQLATNPSNVLKAPTVDLPEIMNRYFLSYVNDHNVGIIDLEDKLQSEYEVMSRNEF